MDGLGGWARSTVRAILGGEETVKDLLERARMVMKKESGPWDEHATISLLRSTARFVVGESSGILPRYDQLSSRHYSYYAPRPHRRRRRQLRDAEAPTAHHKSRHHTTTSIHSAHNTAAPWAASTSPTTTAMRPSTPRASHYPRRRAREPPL